MKLLFTPEAEQQADDCDLWWREHRDAGGLFARELADAQAILRTAPNIGSMHAVLDGLAVRRILLPKTGTHVYYSVDTDRGVVMILAVWGATKGRGPILRSPG